MMDNNAGEAAELFKAFLQPWHTAVDNPAEAQRKVLSTLLEGYAKTDPVCVPKEEHWLERFLEALTKMPAS